MYLIQWLDYSDREDCIEELFEHMIPALKKLYKFHKSNPDVLRDPHLWD
jgi:hypothetical protein